MRLKALFAGAAMMASSSAMALDVPGPLVDSEWLASHLGDDDLVVLDVRHPTKSANVAPKYVKNDKGERQLVRVGGRIAGALVIDGKEVRASREIDGETVKKMVPAKADFEKMMQSWGIDSDDAVVLSPMGFGGGEVTLATRLYWQMKYYGADNIAILNGGTSKWLAEGRDWETGMGSADAGDWTATAERDEILATTGETRDALSSGYQIMDTRAPSQYMGVYTKSYVYDEGHIAGAKNYPNDLLTEAGSGAEFLPAEDYRKMMASMGIDPSLPTITVCNSGNLASGGWFIMHEILGNDEAQLYDGSMHEWTLRGNKAVSHKAD